ncbi:ionotropic receptor 75a [Drosophila willistoni]|uniref:ionotropic receptor 75a n=1 Tax=Drosophila willistoni TaxID=7260 RepID=UPI000C26D534|nr:ionotropic receptor 75a [Drosophila willistoni]
MIKLQVKIILWIFIILPRFSGSRQIENINSNSMKLFAFEDFLYYHNLKHALVVLTLEEEHKIEGIQHLLANYYVQFYNLKKPMKFDELFYYNSPRTGVLIFNYDNDYAKRYIYKIASEMGYFNNTQAWFMMGSGGATNEQTIMEILSGYNINIDADITVALETADNNFTYQLYDVYQINAPLIIEFKGSWSPIKGYQLLNHFKNTWVVRRRDFYNFTLRASTALIEKPKGLDDMSYLANDKELLQFDPMQRKTYQLFKLIQSMYNLSLDIGFTDNWGQMLNNGSWTGVMGQITSHQADFALCPMRFVLDRQSSVQFTPILHTQFIHFLFRHPRRNIVRNIFFEPLSTLVWWSVLALITFSTLLLVLHVRQEHRVLTVGGEHHHRVERHFAFVWFTMMDTYLQQGPDPEMFRLFSTRMLISASSIFGFMLMQFYGAFIVGSLLSDSPRSIVNLQALYDSNLDIGMENISYNFVLFTNTSNQLVRDVYSKRICRNREHNILSIDQGAERLKQGGFAFHAAIDRMYRLLIELLEEHEFCELQEIMFNPPYVASSVLAKSSPWREHLAHAILHLQATGLMQYNDKLWTVPKPDCSLFKAAQVEVDLEHFAPALFALALVMLASGTVFLLELLVGWSKGMRIRCF